MKIVHVLYYPGQGGAEEIIYLLSKEAKKDGQKVEFIFGKDGPFVKRVEKLGFPIHYVDMKSPFDLRAVQSMRKIFKGIKPDIVHTHFLRENFLVISACKGFDIKTFSTVHRIEPKTFLQKLANRRYSKYLTGFIAVSEAVKRYLIKEGIKEDKISMIHNGIELPSDNFIPKDKKSEIFNIGFVGRLSPVKNIPILLSAINYLKNKNNLKVSIVGDGSERTSLEQKVKDLHLDMVSFEGYSEDPSNFYKQFDVLVCPSKKETFGLAILEAMSHGVPVIVSDIEGVTEIVKDKKNGFLFESGNAKELAKKLEMIINSSKLREEFSKNAFMGAQNFTSEKMYEKTKELYLRKY